MLNKYGNHIETTVYTKPTDAHTYLQSQSVNLIKRIIEKAAVLDREKLLAQAKTQVKMIKPL